MSSRPRSKRRLYIVSHINAKNNVFFVRKTRIRAIKKKKHLKKNYIQIGAFYIYQCVVKALFFSIRYTKVDSGMEMENKDVTLKVLKTSTQQIITKVISPLSNSLMF